eukprot:3329994-Rhodomonas_salina.1
MLRMHSAVPGTDIGLPLLGCYARTLPSRYERVRRCPVLTYAMLLPGRGTTERGVWATRTPAAISLCARYAISGTEIGYGATRRACSQGWRSAVSGSR